MTPLWLLMMAITQALAWLASPSESLAAAAQREAVRRQLVGPSVATYNNDTLDVGGAAMAQSPPADRSRDSTAPLEPAPNVRTESWWRERVSAIRIAIAREVKEIAALESEIARLDGQAIARDDPAQQAVLRNQATSARADLEKRRATVLSLGRELTEFTEEARRLDVPPAWLR